jgi:endonuclease YncB( thermonuclease family)
MIGIKMGKWKLTYSILVINIIVVAVWIFAFLLRDDPEQMIADVHVIDGDTLLYNGQVVQIEGIDAPEIGQRCIRDRKFFLCGVEAAWVLQDLIVTPSRGVDCQFNTRHAGSQKVNCSAGGVNVATALLDQGVVFVSSDASDTYLEKEKSAQDGGMGLWQQKFISPEDWRTGQRLPGERFQDPDRCPIKGIFGNGEKVFLVPSDDLYEITVLETKRGDECFYSDEHAFRDGWYPVEWVAYRREK